MTVKVNYIRNLLIGIDIRLPLQNSLRDLLYGTIQYFAGILKKSSVIYRTSINRDNPSERINLASLIASLKRVRKGMCGFTLLAFWLTASLLLDAEPSRDAETVYIGP